MRELVAIVPTRGRPESAMRLQLVFDKSEVARVIFVVDDNDPARAQYEALGVDVLIAPPGGRPGIVDPLNWAFHEVMERLSPPYVAFLGDDHLPQGSWDVEIIETLRQPGPQVCYGNDLLMGERIPTAVFMTSDIPRRLGYMVPPALNHLFADDTWAAWGKGIDRLTYLPDTIVEHLHFLNGKAPNDATYDHCNGPATRLDGPIWAHYRDNGGLAADIKKLKELL